jgi:hypothetical protein
MDQDITASMKENPIQAMIQNIEDVVGHQRLVTEQELRDQRKNSPYMLMAYILARRAHAQDWFSGLEIGNNHTSEYHLHHIFPKVQLSNTYSLRKDSRTVDQVANLVFLASPVSKANSKRLPVEYLPEIDEQRLKAQYVSLQHELWAIDKFEDAMLQRRTMLADAINQFLQSLTEDKRIWIHSPVQVMEARVSALEQQLRQLVEHRLNEAKGESAWKQLVPNDIRDLVEERIKKQEKNKPYEVGQYQTLSAKLAFFQFGDYFKIFQMKTNWLLFEDIFGTEQALAKYSGLANDARNALKHGRELTHVDLASAEAGLTWLEACLAKFKVEEESEVEDVEAVEVV